MSALAFYLFWQKGLKFTQILRQYINHPESPFFLFYVRAVEELIYTYINEELIALD